MKKEGGDSGFPAQKRGQSAVEYLVTYGWVFVVVLVIVGLLVYFEILNPNRFIQESCDFGLQLECEDAQVGREGDVVFMFRNNFGDRINVTGIWSTDLDLPPAQCQPDLQQSGLAITAGFTGKVHCKSTAGLPPDEKIRLGFKVNFTRVYPFAPTHNLSGSMFKKVCDGPYIVAEGRIQDC